MFTPVAVAEAYLDAVRLVALGGEPFLTAVITLGAALGWPGE
jgi:hypothetical protein